MDGKEARIGDNECLIKANGSSEVKYRAVNQGFCLLEKNKNQSGQPIDFRFITTNPEFEDLVGVESVELKTIRQVFPEESDVWVGACDRVLGNGQALCFEQEFITYGRVFELHVFSVPKNGDRVAVIFTDITEHKHKVEALKESEERFRLIADRLSLMISVNDRNGSCQYINKAYMDFFGLTMESVGEEKWHDVLHPEDAEEYISEYLAANGERREFYAETRVRHADGEWRWVETFGSPRYAPSGEFLGITCTNLDITKRKQSEQVSSNNEQHLVLELEAANTLRNFSTQIIQAENVDVLYDQVLEALTTILHADCASFQIFHPERGREGELHLLKHRNFSDDSVRHWEWVTPHDRSTCGIALTTGKRVAVPDVLECDLMAGSSDLEEFLHSNIRAVQTTPLVSRAGTLLGMFSTHWHKPHNLTPSEILSLDVLARQTADLIDRLQVTVAQQESEERYRILAGQLQEADRRKDEFIGTLSHEIRNPLAAIKMGLYLLDSEESVGEKTKMTKEIMGRQVAQLSRLIDDLLDVTRINQNKVILKKKIVELVDLVQKTMEDYKADYEAKQVRLEAKFPPIPLYVDADAARLVQVVGNLLHNAVKFTPEGGAVRVTITMNQLNAVIQVEDNGEGMSPGILSSLFQPFMQADKSLHRSESGLGLGLVLVKGLTEMHGGAVTVHSNGLGKGATFSVRLPLSNESAASQEDQDVPDIQFYRRRILVVEDIKDVAFSIKALLENEGHEVGLAYNGIDSIAIAKEFRPEVLLCDIGLPGMDGYQVAKTFRADKDLNDVLLISLTGYAQPNDFQRAKDAGFQVQIAKPVNLSTLRKALALVTEDKSTV